MGNKDSTDDDNSDNKGSVEGAHVRVASKHYMQQVTGARVRDQDAQTGGVGGRVTKRSGGREK